LKYSFTGGKETAECRGKTQFTLITALEGNGLAKR